MSQVAVYEGYGKCPACPSRHYGQLALDTRAIMQTVQAGAVGAGAGLVTDFITQRLLRITNPLIRSIATVAVPMAIAMFVRRQNPQMAENIAVGGTAVGIYTLLKGLVGTRLGLSGFGEVDVDEDLEGFGEMEPEIEVTEGEYGALVPEVEETEGMGMLVPEIEDTSGYGEIVEVEE